MQKKVVKEEQKNKKDMKHIKNKEQNDYKSNFISKRVNVILNNSTKARDLKGCIKRQDPTICYLH